MKILAPSDWRKPVAVPGATPLLSASPTTRFRAAWLSRCHGLPTDRACLISSLAFGEESQP